MSLYHLTSCGDGREAIFLDDADRRLFLDVMSTAAPDCNWIIHAYCLMVDSLPSLKDLAKDKT